MSLPVKPAPDLGKALDVERIRADFPVLHRQVHPGVPLIYLDSTATSQKPLQVIQAMDDFYRVNNANIHRGIHVLAEEATAAYEGARQRSPNSSTPLPHAR
jgi:cysteine desulfurase/selenocysteine lyase